MWVSTETTYQSLYVQARGGLKREIMDASRTARDAKLGVRPSSGASGSRIRW